MEYFYYLWNVKKRKYMNAIIICGLIVLMIILFNQNNNKSGNLAF